MSERRQLGLLLAGLVTLVAIGVVGATIFPDQCTDLEQLGELELAFTDAADALPVSAEDGVSLEAVGEELGIGPWRGAVALPEAAVVTRSEFGFFIVTAEDFTVLRPSIGIASAARGRAGLDVFSAGTSLALRAADGETGVYNGEYELDRCGALPTDGDVLALDRGFAVVAADGEVVLVTLSGDEVWRAPAAAAAHLTPDGVVLGQDASVELHGLRDGAVVDRLEHVPFTAPVPWAHASARQLLFGTPGGVLPVTVGTSGLERGSVVDLPLAAEPVIAAVTTPGGILAAGPGDAPDGPPRTALATDRSREPAALPPAVDVLALHASEDGHVGVVVEVEGQRALLVYGPDRG